MVECAFGILAQTFRLYFRILKAKPSTANVIITTTCIFHSLIRSNTNVASPDATEMPSNTVNVLPLRRMGGNQLSIEPKDSWLERLQAWFVIHVFLWERAHRKIAG